MPLEEVPRVQKPLPAVLGSLRPFRLYFGDGISRIEPKTAPKRA